MRHLARRGRTHGRILDSGASLRRDRLCGSGDSAKAMGKAPLVVVVAGSVDAELEPCELSTS